jgi:hypothetical protein
MVHWTWNCSAVTSESNPDNVARVLEMYCGHPERVNSDSFNQCPR